MRAQAPEADAGRPGPTHSLAGRGREQNLAAVGHRADAGDGVNGEPDVPGIREGGTSGMNADTDLDLDLVGPSPRPRRPCDRQSGLERLRRPIEDREEFVRASIDLSAAHPTHGKTDQ